ncbi:MAG: L,D-transpeptidase [Gemmatimonadaceae bacterium]
MNHINGLLAAAILAGTAAGAPTDTVRADSATKQDTVAAIAPTASLTLAASLDARILTVRVGDSVVATYAVAVGADGHATPTGTFSIRRLIWNPRWVPPKQPWARGKTAKAPGDPDNPMQTVKIFFREPDYYIHGTPTVESLGEAASKGCLRMDPLEVADVAKWIMEHGGEPRPPSWFERIRRLARREHIVTLKNPIILTITP